MRRAKRLPAAFATCVAFALSSLAHAGWTSNGPPGGQISALAIDPSNPSILYAGSLTSGIFKSTDAGGSWAPAQSGLGSLEVLCLAIDPGTPATLYAGTAAAGILKSTDGGGSWGSASTGLSFLSISAIAIDPSSPLILYAGAFGDFDQPYGGIFHAIFESTDGGGSWTATNFGSLQFSYIAINSLRIDPSTPGTVYAATSAAGIVKTTDGGVTWTSTTARQPAVDVLTLAIDSMNPPNLYAGSGGRTQVYSSTDQGTSWTGGGGGLSPSVIINALAADPSTPTTLYAASQFGGMLKSTDSGATWVGINLGLPAATPFLSIAIDPSTPSTLYAGSGGSGIWKSTDSGGTWSSANNGLFATPILSLDMDPQDPLTAYCGTLDVGAFKTTDGGGSWAPLTLASPGDLVPVIAVSPLTPSTIYAGVNSSIWRSTDSGLTWTATTDICSQWWCNSDIAALAVDPGTDQTLYAGSNSGGGYSTFFKTTDGGATWVQVGSTYGVIGSIVIDPSSSANVYAAAGSLLKSTDAGTSWSTAFLNYGTFVDSASIDPTTPATIYLGATAASWSPPQPGVWKSTDGGTTWTDMSTGMGGADVNSVAVDAAHPWTLYAATDGGGVYVSIDGAQTWTPFNDGLYCSTMESVIVDATGLHLWAGADAGGVFDRLSCYSTLNPVITSSGPTTFCEGGTVTLDAGAGYASYLWLPNGETTQNIVVSTSGTFGVTVSDGYGCTLASPLVLVTVNPLPTAVAGGGRSICAGGSVGLTGSGGVSCSWTPTTGLSDPNSCAPNASSTVTTTYTLTVADLAGCTSTNAASATVTVSPIPTPVITVTHCLTPNTSGLTASVPTVAGDTYNWTIAGGTIDSGQGTDAISFTSGGPATLMTLTVDETNPTGCVGSTGDSMEVNFLDVPPSNPFYNFICTIARHAMTAGCGSGNFCPTDSVLRSQMAVFLLRGEHGPAYLPPVCAGIFADVTCPSPFADWIEQLYNEGITGGCSTTPLMYCPGNNVSRAGMAVFLLVAEHGTGYVPPACASIFTDVACPSPFADWIEELYNEGITGGCGTNPLIYCPGNSVTRAQMSVFLTVTFALP